MLASTSLMMVLTLKYWEVQDQILVINLYTQKLV
nr:MAG TPA: hypothetical protein [Caudoviricetes sp.]